MFGLGLIEMVVALGLPVLLVVLLVGYASGRLGRRGVRESGRVIAGWLAGALAGLIAAVVLLSEPVASFNELGRGAMLAPVVLGVGVLLGVILGETVARPAPATARTAGVAPRRIRDHLPRGLTYAVATILAGTLALLAGTTLTASADDRGRAGRALTRECTLADGMVTASSGPYPGSFYSLWLAGGLLIAVLVAAVAARSVVLRPRGVAADEGGDDVLRRRSAAAVVAGLGVAASAPAIGIAVTTGLALQGHGCGGATWDVLALICAGWALASAAVLIWALVTLVLPGSAVPVAVERRSEAAYR